MTHLSDESRASRSGEPLTRRGVVRGAALGGLALPLLAACGSSSNSTGGSSPQAPAGGTSGSGGSSAGTVATADVPVDGGVILPDAKVVVTQPSKGEFKAFTAVCTHAGCLVGSVADGKIICPCHGSQFSIADGSVAQGPATTPLAAAPFKVKGDQVVLG
ncbi:Rieske (2Fe-2S) protein [Nocardioides mesophilus]|uniref:Cytochrome bc1 complex Rieske iron-sulfur subunit n=1 Tax=Nocardioides mesophilus TaxID=433659 RepID=A0A7G9RBD5_9ACTN|nr:Rieske (2Fe-2S) protein [Nocardioides mesophilus]QNN52910.1 Rieske (2Fe-2S) protein [Nocardioides mesophilus]